jgi:hypothetical protein
MSLAEGFCSGSKLLQVRCVSFICWSRHQRHGVQLASSRTATQKTNTKDCLLVQGNAASRVHVICRKFMRAVREHAWDDVPTRLLKAWTHIFGVSQDR